MFLKFICAMSILFTSVIFLSPPFNDVYRVPDAFLQRFGAMTAWEHSLSSVACCNATLTIHSLFRMVEVKVRGASCYLTCNDSWGQYSCQAYPEIKNSCRGRPGHWECGRVCLPFTMQRFHITLFYWSLNSSTGSQKTNLNLFPLSGSVVLLWDWLPAVTTQYRWYSVNVS